MVEFTSEGWGTRIEIEGQSLMMISLIEKSKQKLDLVVELCSYQGEFLPHNLQLRLLSESGLLLEEVRFLEQSCNPGSSIEAKRNEVLPGNVFNVEVIVGDTTFTNSVRINEHWLSDIEKV